MSFNYMEDMLARLQKGESIEDIAAQVTKDINAANEAYVQEKKEAERKAQLLKEDKVSWMHQLIADLYGLLSVYGASDVILDPIITADAEELVKELDKAWPQIQELGDALSALNEKTPSGDSYNDYNKYKKNNKTDDPLEKFLNEWVR